VTIDKEMLMGKRRMEAIEVYVEAAEVCIKAYNHGKDEALAKPIDSQGSTGILPVFHGRDAHATRGFARTSDDAIIKIRPEQVDTVVQWLKEAKSEAMAEIMLER
jgi:hypothetical protein